MVSSKTSSVLLLQAAAFISGVIARCQVPCSPKDSLVVLLQSAEEAVPFCSDFLSLPTSTVIITPEATVSTFPVTTTSYVTELTTEIDGTVTVTVTTPSPITALAVKKRDDSYPSWLPTTYLPERVSSACSCLSIPLSVATETASAEVIIVTEPVTATVTTINIVHSTAIVTETAQPVVIQQSFHIEVLEKSTQASIGWLINSNGIAIGTSSDALTASIEFTLAPGETTASDVRINFAGITPSALGFDGSNLSERFLEDYYGLLTTMEPTSPGSPPVISGNDQLESDIWIISTETNLLSWQWITTTGARPDIALYRVGGRIYPVGNLARFTSSTSGVSAEKYEVSLRVGSYQK